MLEKHYGELTEGCKRCAKGEKLVLFITGLCPRSCVYCPLSEEKKNKDVTFANEREVNCMNDLIEEVKLSGATGAGITGGDPLARFERTLDYIKKLKQNFGEKFHIHLYTSLDLLTKEKITLFEESGLDELRVHPDIENRALWPKLSLLEKTKMGTVVEIPSIPKKEAQILELIKYARDKVNAFNLNEFELAQLYIKEFKTNRWKTNKDGTTIKGSEKTALNVIKKARGWHVRIHYCSARFKDEVQFNGRIKNYAKNIALPTDKITNAGTLLRGAIYSDLDLEKLKEKYPNEFFFFDKEKNRILCSVKFVKLYFKEVAKCAIVEEYPTKDKTEIYKEFLN